MSVIKPQPFQAVIEEKNDKIVITNSGRKSWALTHWLGFLLEAPGFVILSAIVISFGLLITVSLTLFGLLQWLKANGITPDPFAFPYPLASVGFVLLPFWLVAFIAVAKTIHGLLWLLFGTEIIEIDKAALKIHLKLFNLNRPSVYSLDGLSDFQVDTRPHIPATWRSLFINAEYLTGRIKFKHNRKTVRFGVGLKEAEANRILEIIQKHFPKFPVKASSASLPIDPKTALGKVKIENTSTALTITIPNQRKRLLII